MSSNIDTNVDNSKQVADISIFIIATKNYVVYAKLLIESFIKFTDSALRVEFVLLTDARFDFFQEISLPDHLTISVASIESLGWPEATLFRFRLMSAHSHLARGHRIAYIDADMVVSGPVFLQDFLSVIDAQPPNQMVLVRHPGYFSRTWLIRLVVKTPFGPWGSSPRSQAFVPFGDRETYVCGGFFWGERSSFFGMCDELAHAIDLDQSAGVRAKHNDESHLNKWFVENGAALVGPEWVFAPGYRNLRGIPPRISVIHKPSEFERIPTEHHEGRTTPYYVLKRLLRRNSSRLRGVFSPMGLRRKNR